VIRDVSGTVIRRLGALLALCGTVALAAPELRKPSPDAAAEPDRERLETLVKERYPQLGERHASGTPVVTILFEADGRVARTDLEVRSVPPEGLTATEEQFNRFGHLDGQLHYISMARIELPANTVLVVFAGLDSRDLDRALVERYFPQTLTQGVPDEGVWILFDHKGRVLRTGEERLQPADLRSLLESRYPGIRTSDMTVTPVVDRYGDQIKNSSGKALQLYCVWLAVGSPTPET